MKSSLMKSLILGASILMVVGCGGSSSSSSGDEELSTLSQELKDSITYMYNEEGLAYDVYLNVYNELIKNDINVSQLQNIASGEQSGAEKKHIEAVNELAIKYDLNMTTYDPTLEPYSKEGIGDGKYSVQHIQDLYDALYPKGIKTKRDALEVGCMVEVVDIVDLEHYIKLAEESNALDVLEVFNFLLAGSYTHYWAFHDGLVNMGIEEGCCQVRDEFSLGLDFCHDESEYPRK